MPKEIHKILGQVRPAINTETILYTVPDKRAAIVKVTAFNEDGSAALIKVAIVPDGGADTPPATAAKNYVVNGFSLDPKKADQGTELKGITVNEFDQIRVESDNAVTVFHCYGVEIEP